MNAEDAWDLFYQEALTRMDAIYPIRNIKMSSADPPFLTPTIKPLLRRKNHLSDQYALCPTGSTTSALISIQHNTSSLLKSNPYVTLIGLEFSKAFNMVRHSSLTQKLAALDLPDAIYNWIVNFIDGRSHVTRYDGATSILAYINSSVFQGSGIGPSSYEVLASDLHTIHQLNILVKYADDTYLIFPASCRQTIPEELEHIPTWAEQNNLKLNVVKSKEMIIYHRANFESPPTIKGITRVTSMRVLGVTLSEDRKVTEHVSEILSCVRVPSTL